MSERSGGTELVYAMCGFPIPLTASESMSSLAHPYIATPSPRCSIGTLCRSSYHKSLPLLTPLISSLSSAMIFDLSREILNARLGRVPSRVRILVCPFFTFAKTDRTCPGSRRETQALSRNPLGCRGRGRKRHPLRPQAGRHLTNCL